MKKLIAYVLSLSIIISLFPAMPAAAAEKWISWLQTATMDINLNIIENKAGVDDLLFELNLAEPNNYKLEYFLNDGEKRTLEIRNNPNDLQVAFMIENGTQAVHSNETENQMNISFLSVDYSGDIPQWKSYQGADLAAFKAAHLNSGKLTYTIDKTASAKFPGIAFNINNRMLMLRGDFNSNKAYLYLDKYQVGTIFPIKLTNPLGEVQQVNALKSLRNFTTTPTHLIKDPSHPGQNYEPTPIVVPGALNSEKAGSRPGIRIKFEQPKAIDDVNWKFEYDKAKPILQNLSAVFDLKDLAGPDNMDIGFGLDPDGAKTITSLPAGNTGTETYIYDPASHTYQIDIVKDKTHLDQQNMIVQWNGLEKSKIYKAKLNFQKKVGHEDEVDFPAFSPQNEFAYTYMEFTLRRADQKEAYLEITPYDVGDNVDLEYTILYNKTYVGNLDENNHLWLRHYQRNDKAQAKINIPVPFNDNSSTDHYQVLFRFSSTNIRSQLLNYQAEKDKDVPPAMPNIVSVDNLYVTPPDQDAPDQSIPSQIQLDLVWQAIDKVELAKVFQLMADDPLRDNNPNNDAVYYELAVNTLPGETPENKYEVIQVYKVTKAADGTYHLSVHPSLSSDTWQGTPSQTGPQYANGYDKIDELFRMEKIILNKEGKWPLAHTTVYDEDHQTYTVTAQADPTKRIKDLAFPGVNYFRIRAYVEKDAKVSRSRASMPYSFSMSMLIYDVPTANNLRYEPVYNVNGTIPEGVAVYWDWNKNKTDFKTFKEAMLDPLGKEAVSITYVGYISKDRQKLMKITPEDKQNLLQLQLPETQAERKIRVTPQELEKFRAGEVFYFAAKDLNLGSLSGKIPGGEFLTQITGLDPNDVYYIRFVVEIQVKNGDGTFEMDSHGEKKPRTSVPSVILEMTVPKVNPEPGENEKLPLAPEKFRVDFLDDEKVQSYAEWEMPPTISPEDKNYGFELLNVEDQSLAEALRENTIALEDLLNGSSVNPKTNALIQAHGIHNNNAQAYRVVNFTGEWKLQVYNISSKAWEDAQQADFSMNDRTIRVIDKRNSPNRVLYYYLRTVKYNNTQGVLSRSRWREATLTTPEMKRPINLIVDYSNEIDHNPKEERIIRFDVPLPEGVVLHENYLVQIFVRGEKDPDFVETNKVQANGQILYGSTYIKTVPGAPTSYQRLYYKVYGLEPGKAYDIKVRLEDHTKEQQKNPDGSYTYSTSPFSDVVRTRTEFDQTAHDKEGKYKEYLDYYVKRAEELKKAPYFDLTTDKKKNVFKYRGQYASGEMRNQMKAVYDLVKGEGEMVTYYLPAEWIQAAPEFDVDLRLWIKEQQFILPAGFVTEDATAALRDVIRRVKEYQGAVKDYSVMIQLTAGKYGTAIEGELPLEPMVNISLSVVRETKNETYIDNMLQTAVDNAVSKNKPALIAELEKELKYGLKDNKLNEIVNKVLVQVQKDFAAFGQFQYLSLVSGNRDYITELNKAMKVSLNPTEKIEYQVFFREAATWQPLERVSDGSVRSGKTGSFVAVPDTVRQHLADISTDAEISIIRKNGLMKVFTTYELSQDGGISGEQLVRTAARLLGAGDSNDTAAFLRSQGITVPACDPYYPVSREKAYYVLAQVYAKRNSKPLANVRITDFYGIEDQNEIDAKFRKDLLAAYHLKLLTLRNGKLSPKASFAMNELRNFLRKL